MTHTPLNCSLYRPNPNYFQFVPFTYWNFGGSTLTLWRRWRLHRSHAIGHPHFIAGIIDHVLHIEEICGRFEILNMVISFNYTNDRGFRFFANHRLCISCCKMLSIFRCWSQICSRCMLFLHNGKPKIGSIILFITWMKCSYVTINITGQWNCTVRILLYTFESFVT